MIIGVFGPRDFKGGAEKRIAETKGDRTHFYNNFNYIADALDEYEATKVVTGGGNGIEQLALRYAVEKELEHEVVPPNMAEHGHDAFRVRNSEIIVMCDLIVLFWDGKDKFYFDLMAETVEQKTLLHLRHME